MLVEHEDDTAFTGCFWYTVMTICVLYGAFLVTIASLTVTLVLPAVFYVPVGTCAVATALLIAVCSCYVHRVYVQSPTPIIVVAPELLDDEVRSMAAGLAFECELRGVPVHVQTVDC